MCIITGEQWICRPRLHSPFEGTRISQLHALRRSIKTDADNEAIRSINNNACQYL